MTHFKVLIQFAKLKCPQEPSPDDPEDHECYDYGENKKQWLQNKKGCLIYF